MERGERCKIIKDLTSVEFEIKKDRFFNATRVCFREKPPRREREKINKELNKCKLRTIWGDTCLVVK